MNHQLSGILLTSMGGESDLDPIFMKDIATAVLVYKNKKTHISMG